MGSPDRKFLMGNPLGGGGGGGLQSYLPYIYLQKIYIFIKKEERKKGM